MGQNEKPLAIDLCCGLGGWTEGLLAEGYRVRGYDIEAHEYGDERYPAELVLKSILDLRGEDVADADLIVASPPCTEYSYMAMPWTRAKQIARALRGEDAFPEGYKGSRTVEELNALFDACFRIQREASQAAGRHIPMVVENVRGAEPWVGRAAWAYGSYYLWGDVPALMPRPMADARKANPDGTDHGTGSWFAIADSKDRGASGRKNPGFRFDGSGKSFQTESVNRHVAEGMKPPARVSDRPADDGRKSVGSGAAWFDQNIAPLPSGSKRRKAASAKIAKIPFALSSHIARVYRPSQIGEAA